RHKKVLLINAGRQEHRQCNQVSREFVDLITTENGLLIKKFPHIPVPEDEDVKFGSNEEEEVIESEVESGTEGEQSN
ncbi:hypothetical protein MKX03_017446, partial [Papaver bracteatum]